MNGRRIIDLRIVSASLWILLTAVFVTSPAGAASADAGNQCVILLHGMARTSDSMNKMQRSLEERGYFVANVSYPSRHHEIEVLAPMAVEDGLNQCHNEREFDTVHFVTHSLGGILVRYYLDGNSIENLGRVVMLGPPNQGSDAADAMQNVPGFGWINGPAALQLGKGPDSIPLQLGAPDFEVGVIAGDRTIDPITSAVLDNPDDGRVSVEDTKLEGMQDFRQVSASHAFIMKKEEVIELVATFLEYGSFEPPAKAE